MALKASRLVANFSRESSFRLAPSLAVVGASGRLGRRVMAFAHDWGFQLSGAYAREGSHSVGSRVDLLAGSACHDVCITAAPACLSADVVIDVSQPEGVAHSLLALDSGVAYVVGVTGLSANLLSSLQEAAQSHAVVVSPNFSAGVHVLANLAARAARALPSYDVEVVDLHHRNKVDAPSGTALLIGDAVAAAREWALQDVAIHGRQGHVGVRPTQQVGFHALRMGDVVGEHEVWLAGDGERLRLGHVATSRDAFAHGALRAARWLCGKPPGLYNMHDVLGLTSPLHDA